MTARYACYKKCVKYACVCRNLIHNLLFSQAVNCSGISCLWQKPSDITGRCGHFCVTVDWTVLWAVVYKLLNSVQIFILTEGTKQITFLTQYDWFHKVLET